MRAMTSAATSALPAEGLRITVPASDLDANPFIDADGKAPFYRLIAGILGIDYDKVGEGAIDPSRIHVSPALVDTWLKGGDTPAEQEYIAMLIVNYGPRADETLAYNEIVIDGER